MPRDSQRLQVHRSDRVTFLIRDESVPAKYRRLPSASRQKRQRENIPAG